jgi:hypothetical protein
MPFGIALDVGMFRTARDTAIRRNMHEVGAAFSIAAEYDRDALDRMRLALYLLANDEVHE